MAIRNAPPQLSAVAHVRHRLGHALRAIVLTGLVCAVLGGALTEAVAWYLTRAVPTMTTHIAAIVIALSLGYAAAATTALRAVFGMVIGSMEWVVGEVEHIAVRAVQEAETLVGAAPGQRALVPTGPRHGPGYDRGSDAMAGGVLAGIPDEPPAGPA